MQRPSTPPLYRPPSNIPFHIHLATWSSREIDSFLQLQRCGHHSKKFEDNDITGSVILELGADELKELGVNKVGERVRLLGAIRELKKRNSISLAGLNAGTGRDSSNGGSTPASASSFASVQAQQQGGHQRTMSTMRRTGGSESLDAGRRHGEVGLGIDIKMNGHQGGSVAHHDYANRPPNDPAKSLQDHQNETGATGLSRSRSGTGGSLRRLHATRPPPLHLHSSSHGQINVQNNASAQPGRGDSNVRSDQHNSNGMSSTATTPRGMPASGVPDMNGPGSNGSLVATNAHTMAGLQPGSGSSVDSLNPPTTAGSLARASSLRNRAHAYPAAISGGSSNVPGPQDSHGKLRAPVPNSSNYGTSPPGSSTHPRRTPSPLPGASSSNPVPIARRGSNEYMARPLPGLPPEETTAGRPNDGLWQERSEDFARKSSAGSGSSRPSGGSFGSTRSGGGSENRPATSSGALGIPVTMTHRRGASTVPTSQAPASRGLSTISTSDPRRAGSKRPSTDSGTSIHPYAASAPRSIKGHSPTKGSGSPTKSRFDANRGASEGQGDITPTYPMSSENRKWYNSPSRSPNDEYVHVKGQRSWSDRWASEKSSTPTLSLEDVKRKLVKFILAEDETSRTIDVEACQNGFEVLEKALRKFGKWRGIARGGATGLSESESENDETSCLDVDGWGVFLQKNDDCEWAGGFDYVIVH